VVVSRKGTVSIGICAYNEERNIGRLIENLLNQSLAGWRLVEVVVVASGCTDRTVQIVADWCLRDSRVKLITRPTREGKIPAINELLRKYLGEILIHVDADHIPNHGALNLLLEHLKDPQVGAVSGHQIPVDGGRFMDKINVVVWGLHNETQFYLNHAGKAQHLGGVLFAIRRGICGWVPEDAINDDAFMGVQCRLKEYRIHFESDALAFFNGAKNLREFVAQRRRVLYGHLQVKKLTHVNPMVFETAPLLDKLRIFQRWLMKHWSLLHYFTCACLIEAWSKLLAASDQIHGDGRHRIWTIATSTKSELTSIAPNP